MERIKSLNLYQKIVLILMAILVAAFAVVYYLTISKVGFAYKDQIFVAGQEGSSTVYTGKLNGKQAKFTVTEDKTVTFDYNGLSYGPYTSVEDSTAVPKGNDMAQFMTGIELRKANEILFRGGYMNDDGTYWLFSEDNLFEISYTDGNGSEWDSNGELIDEPEPTYADIIRVMYGPVLTHKGSWIYWFTAFCICIFNAVLILYADAIFRWNLKFRIRNADTAEPSSFELAGRYITWTLLPILALICLIIGLK